MSSSAKRKLRDKKRKEEERKRARGEGEAPAPKIYRAWFMLRDSFFENNKTLHRHDVLQVSVARQPCVAYSSRHSREPGDIKPIYGRLHMKDVCVCACVPRCVVLSFFSHGLKSGRAV